MSRRPSSGVRRPLQTPLTTSPSPVDDAPGPSAPRPAIWAEGKQAPSFAPKAFVEAGMLLAREDAGLALDYMSTEAAAKAARIEDKDWQLESRFGKLGRVLPTAPGVARSLDAFAHQADAARRLLYGQEPAKPEAPKPAVQAVPLPVPRPAPSQPDPVGDPDLAAIRALLITAPEPAPPRRPAGAQPANWEVSPPPDETAPVLHRVLDWSIVRVLAGSVLVFATPIGYGRALYRHLDGADLREIVMDCHRMRIN
jgi:hypothetical protein